MEQEAGGWQRACFGASAVELSLLCLLPCGPGRNYYYRGESTCRRHTHTTSGWMHWNPPAERSSRAPEFLGTHGELQSTKVSMCVLKCLHVAQCCKDLLSDYFLAMLSNRGAGPCCLWLHGVSSVLPLESFLFVLLPVDVVWCTKLLYCVVKAQLWFTLIPPGCWGQSYCSYHQRCLQKTSSQ